MQNNKINILLVDDQPSKLLSYQLILAELGENLIGAASPREAFELLLRNEIAVILMDVQMPELDGFELAAQIREHPRFEKTAIIFVSAIHLSDLDQLKGYAAGAVDYVSVPIVPEVLRAKVRVFAELYRKTRQLERMNEELEMRVAERTAELESAAQALASLNEDLERRIEIRTCERESALAQLFEAQKMETIGHLTGGVAHDFNNLLMAILGSLELVRKRIKEPRATHLINNAMEGAQRGAALTKRLLAFARRQELNPVAVDVVTLVEGMKDLLWRAIGPSVRLTKSFPDSLPPIKVDPHQLELALLNLAVNARDAMPDGGSLGISAELLDAPVRGLDHLRPGDYVCLSLADSGIGMDEATLAKATEPFFTTKGPGKGTGLGLSMVHGMAAQSGGALHLTSLPGTGTVVRLILPVADERATNLAVAPVKDMTTLRTNSNPITVLVVDDDSLVRTGTAAMLDDLGHSVLEASSGPEALLLLAQAKVDLAIIDFAMPGMTGAELIRHIGDRFDALPTILVSGYAEAFSTELSNSCIRLPKPFTQGELASALAHAVDGNGAPDGLAERHRRSSEIRIGAQKN